jgi:ankyrin repeat protein
VLLSIGRSQSEELILPPKGFITTNEYWNTNSNDFQKATGYVKAAIDGDISNIEELIKSGASPNEATEHGFTPVMVASTTNNIPALTMVCIRDDAILF